MRSACWVVILLMIGAGWPAMAQDAVGDLLAGDLIKPKVGQWAWYDVRDVKSGRKYVLRQAVVGKERVGRKTAYWVELEIVPEVGYRSIVKLLVSGAAANPENIHRVIRKTGPEPAEEVPIPKPTDTKPTKKEKREKLGKTTVSTPSGSFEATHYTVSRGGRRVEIWTSNDVRPSGIVRLRSADGDMTLRSLGEGGKAAQSVLDGIEPSR